MIALPETSPSTPSRNEVLLRDWRQLYAGALEKCVEFIPRFDPTTSFDNHGCLQRVRRRHAAVGGRRNHLLESRRIGLAVQDCKQSRAVDDQRGKPRSS